MIKSNTIICKSVMFLFKQGALGTKKWRLRFLFKENNIQAYKWFLILVVLFLMLHFYYVGKGHAFEGLFAQCLLLLMKNVLCLALWLFLLAELKWTHENVACSILLYSFNEKFFPIYVRQCLSELISHYVKEKSTWLILKELFDT